MPKFKYAASDSGGKVRKGEIVANTEAAAYTSLKEQGLYCNSLFEVNAKSNQRKEKFYKMRLVQVATFCRQLSIMLASGMTIIRAINILYEKESTPNLRKTFLRLYEDIQKGGSLYEAMSSQGNAFPMLLKQMINAGEQSGTLDGILLTMADYYEKEKKTTSQLSTALTYPCFLVGVMVVVMIGLFVFVLPKFFTMFGDVELPAITQAVMAISSFLTYKWYILVIAVVLIIMFISWLYRVEKFVYFKDWLKLSFPVFKVFFKTLYAQRFTSAFAILYSSGLPIIQALEILSQILNNAYITKKFNTVIEEVRKGEMFSTSIEKTKVFDDLLSSMAYMGEESGDLDTIMAKVSVYYDTKLQAATQRMLSLVEPLMMIIIAILITIVIVSVLLPIYGMYGSIV